MTNHETAAPTETDRLHAEILEGRAQISELRDLLRSENQRANAAIDRETTAEQAAIEAQAGLARLRAVVARLTQMTDHWERQLPEVIRTPAVVSAIRAALEPAVSVPPPAPRADDQTALRDRIAERPERYAVAIHDAMESDLSLVDQEPGQQALFARAAEAVMALADSEQATLRRKLAAAEKIRENADFHLGQEMARRQLAEKEAARLSADQAAVLNAAAQHLYTALFPAVYDDMGQKAAEGVNRAVSELRRLAAVSGPCVAGEQQNETPETEAAAYRLAVTAIEAMPGYPRLVLPEEIVAELRRLADEAPTTTKPETDEPASTCTCGVAGDAFVPLGHYRDCPDAAGVRQDGVQP